MKDKVDIKIVFVFNFIIIIKGVIRISGVNVTFMNVCSVNVNKGVLPNL